MNVRTARGESAHPGGFAHDAARPLAIDVLVVDEASMLDLALATRLFEAVPDTARLILLGDKDQLAAVESGAVFAELSADPSLGVARPSSQPRGVCVDGCGNTGNCSAVRCWSTCCQRTVGRPACDSRRS